MKGITASKYKLDFGEVERNSLTRKTVELHNESDENILMTPWRSCGCTEPILGTNPLLAGESTTLEIVFDSTGKSGYQEKTVGIKYYLAGEAKVLTIEFKVKIKK